MSPPTKWVACMGVEEGRAPYAGDLQRPLLQVALIKGHHTSLHEPPGRRARGRPNGRDDDDDEDDDDDDAG